MSHYSENEAIISADQLSEKLPEYKTDFDPHRLIEVSFDSAEYQTWHIPGATNINWEEDIQSGVGGKILSKEEFEELMAENGVSPDTTVVLYGDKANWFAAHAYWTFKYYGHDDVVLLDGGRRYWSMNDYERAQRVPDYSHREYEVSEVNDGIRAYKDEVERATETETALIDVRNPQEYRGDKPPAEVPETTDREGHIPSAENVPWGQAVDMDGTFKHPEELRDVYEDKIGDEDVISYCRIGERSSITWFVLHELLGEDISNYDGSFTEWESDEDAEVATGGDDQ